MTIMPLSGPVRSMATLGGRQSTSRFIGQAARPRRMLIRGGERTAATAPTGTGCADRACIELPIPLGPLLGSFSRSHTADGH
jgi:hypothetical protein